MTDVHIIVRVPRDKIANVLINALEGGARYWACIETYYPPPDGANLFEGLEGVDVLGDEVFRHIHYPLCKEGGGIVIGDANVAYATSEDADFAPTILNYKAILRGVQTMSQVSPLHFAKMLTESGDAHTGDVFLQCCLFGEVRYG